jgi:hypothetical protein
MRRWRGVLVGLLAGLCVGCTTGDGARPATSLFGGLRPLQVPAGADIVRLDVALLERRVGDPYLNEGLWTLADESGVPLESRAALEENGFRIGQVGGLPPPELLALLTSERSCANPRQIRLHTGDAKDLLLGPILPVCRFQVLEDGEPDAVNLEQAQLMLSVVPTLTRDGRIALHFTPQVEHGEAQLVPCPAPDHSGMVLQRQRAVNRYTALSWDVTLAPNEYVVVGARGERRESLGYQAFVRPQESPPVQRLLVLRASRTAPGAPDDTPGDAAESIQRCPPVAFQASSSPTAAAGP